MQGKIYWFKKVEFYLFIWNNYHIFAISNILHYNNSYIYNYYFIIYPSFMWTLLSILWIITLIAAVVDKVKFYLSDALYQSTNREKGTFFYKKNYSPTDSKEPRRRAFELYIQRAFNNKWYKTRIGDGQNDGGKDIVVEKNGERKLIQCKRRFWTRIVREKHLRAFQWAIDLYNKKYQCNAWWIFITTGKSTSYARKYAENLWIQLRDYLNREIKIQNI